MHDGCHCQATWSQQRWLFPSLHPWTKPQQKCSRPPIDPLLPRRRGAVAAAFSRHAAARCGPLGAQMVTRVDGGRGVCP